MPLSPIICPNTFLIPSMSYFILSYVGSSCRHGYIVAKTSLGALISNLLSYLYFNFELLPDRITPIVGFTRPFLNIFKIIWCSVYYTEAYLRYLFGLLFYQSYVYQISLRGLSISPCCNNLSTNI